MKALRILAGISYPFVVYAGLTRAGPRALAAALAVLLLLQALVMWGHGGRAVLAGFALPAAGLGAVVLLAGFFNEGRFFLFVPTLVNAALLVAFARTLWTAMPMVERFARLQGHHLTAEKIAHCRRSTVMWCGFFVFNGAVSLWLALWGSLEHWTLYTGGLSYLLIGLLLGAELVYRYWRFRPYEDGSIADPLFRKIFPPRKVG